MPKLVALFYGAESPASTLAEAAAEGAKSVRFTEVDVRAGAAHQAPTKRAHKRLESADALRVYDGIILVCPAAGEVPADASALLDELEHASADAFLNTVFGVMGGENTTLLGRVAGLGGIIIGEARGVEDPEERARRLGARTAKVIGWVHHALGHEHDHSHGHHSH